MRNFKCHILLPHQSRLYIKQKSFVISYTVPQSVDDYCQHCSTRVDQNLDQVLLEYFRKWFLILNVCKISSQLAYGVDGWGPRPDEPVHPKAFGVGLEAHR